MLTTKACGLGLLLISHCVYGRLNMLNDGTSGSNKLRISKQECCMVGSMVCVVFDLQSETCELTSLTMKQQQHILDRMDTWLFASINGMVLGIPQVAEPLSAILLLSRLHVKDVIVLHFPVELYMLCPGAVRLTVRPQRFKNASSVRTAPSFYGY
ncbi:hypothetical protein O0I10_013204 [Lichtheimia ornata]|uniref:Secreted protein n=1 Tax=Lichtheimia ornata TaxID=688661 RepID=A0AAD7XSG6_9FUNG|nr:uncharacterized protein O0I10_013204 [Lichtheimia ornata]KAJ8651308.1 hypothetical protein O0I10_013204 [Lichtheimia ornata]